MRKKYRTGLKLVGFLLILSIFVLISYIKYLNDVENNNPVVIVEEGLSINYLKGNIININDTDSTYTFSVTNNSNLETSYYIYLDNLMSTNMVKYDLTERNNKVNILKNELTKTNPNLAEMININPGETHSYNLKIYSNPDVIKTKIVIEKEENNEEYFASTIIKNNEIQVSEINTEVPVSLTDGLIEAKNDYGKFYYFKGYIENNYVLFAGLLWRIVAINSDGSVKLILNDYAEATANFYNADDEELIEDKLNFSKNKMYETLDLWYRDNLEKYENNLISNRYCVDDSIINEDGINTYYGSKDRLVNNNYSYNCLGTIYTSRIGLLSLDEIIMAGASMTEQNQSFYLYLPNKVVSWWTITPRISDSKDITFFEITKEGKIGESSGNYFRGVRPVINLVKKTIVTGSGTLDDPYITK